MQEAMIPIRVIYSKTGRVRYISHLDTMRTITRALRRSGLPWWYTQGFNPHLYLTFPLPLALGVESLCEIVDLRLTEEVDPQTIKQRIGKHLPPGFEIKSVGAPNLPAKAICWAQYQLELGFAPQERESAASKITQLLGGQSISVSKKTKKGEQQMDIRPHLSLTELSKSEIGLVCDLRLAAGTSLNVSPRLVLEALSGVGVSPQSVKTLRTRVLDELLNDFS